MGCNCVPPVTHPSTKEKVKEKFCTSTAICKKGTSSLTAVYWCTMNVRRSWSCGDSTPRCRSARAVRCRGTAATPPPGGWDVLALLLLFYGHGTPLSAEPCHPKQTYPFLYYCKQQKFPRLFPIFHAACSYLSVGLLIFCVRRFGLDSDSLYSMDKIHFKSSFQPTPALKQCDFVMSDDSVLSM